MIKMILTILIYIVAALVVVLIHEVSKYYFSLSLLHPIHRKRSDMRVDVKKFIDPIGIFLFVFSGVGWQKPGEYNPSRFKDKEKGLLVLSVVGMGSNFLVMLALIPLFIYVNTLKAETGYYLTVFIFQIIRYSFAIIIVNLLPVPPLDMTKIIYALNPSFYFKMVQNERIIQAIFILILAFGVLDDVVRALFYPFQQLMF